MSYDLLYKPVIYAFSVISTGRGIYIMTITIREPGSALTHLAGTVLALFAAYPMLIKAARNTDTSALPGMAVFMASMIMLYLASTLYHSVTGKASLIKRFRKMDHMMIFVLIAGSYTPVCLLVLKGFRGFIFLAVIWGLASIGMIVKMCWITCPKWFSSILYTVMGWTCVFIFGDLIQKLSAAALAWLLAGGLIYTAGGVIYAIKIPVFRERDNFGNHELFHLLVMCGSICHFIFMYRYLI